MNRTHMYIYLDYYSSFRFFLLVRREKRRGVNNKWITEHSSVYTIDNLYHTVWDAAKPIRNSVRNKKGGFALVKANEIQNKMPQFAHSNVSLLIHLYLGVNVENEEEFSMRGQSRKMPHSHSYSQHTCTPVPPLNDSYESCHVMSE